MEKQLFNILILLAVFSQGISVSFEEDEQLSDILHREKRVVHASPGAAVARYVASIMKDGNHICGGAILSKNIILTAAFCFDQRGEYAVFAGSGHINEARGYYIMHKEIHPHYNPHNFANNLALLLVSPNISLHFRSFNRGVTLYNQEIHSNALAVLSGWGSRTLEGAPGILYPLFVQSAHVNVLTWRDCATTYGNEHTQITNYEICTHDYQGLRRSGYGDVGSPLTVAGYLVGILSWSRVVVNLYTPDVYTNVALPVYREWINQFMRVHG